MIITKKWLVDQDACREGKDWVRDNAPDLDGVELVKRLMESSPDNPYGLDWANWLIVRIMTRPKYLAYAIYAEERWIDIYESKYPDDPRPRNAIEAAKAVLENDTQETRAAARAAWAAARAAARDAGAAAWAAGDTGAAARDAARAAGDAARDAAGDAGDAGDATLRKILDYGVGLMEKGKTS